MHLNLTMTITGLTALCKLNPRDMQQTCRSEVPAGPNVKALTCKLPLSLKHYGYKIMIPNILLNKPLTVTNMDQA